MAAQKMGIQAKIVMPVFTPTIKISSVKSFGAEVVLFGNDFDAAKAECFRLVKETGKNRIRAIMVGVGEKRRVHNRKKE